MGKIEQQIADVRSSQVELPTDETLSSSLSAREKLVLEARQFGDGIVLGLTNTIESAWQNPGATAITVASSAVMPYLLTALIHKSPELRPLNSIIQTAFLIGAADQAATAGELGYDTWKHPEHFDANTELITKNIGEPLGSALLYTVPIALGFWKGSEHYDGARVSQSIRNKFSEDGDGIPALKVSAFSRIYPTYERTSPLSESYERLEDKVVQIRTSFGAGTGFLVEGGYVATNNHVIEGAGAIEVVGSRGEKSAARLVARDKSDLALLRPENRQALPEGNVKIGSTSNIHRGDIAFTIGHPHGTESSVLSSGTIEHMVVIKEKGVNTATMVADLTIRPGNSGGPLFNEDEELLGVVAKGSPYSARAISVEHLQTMIEQTKAHEIPNGWLEFKSTIKPGEAGTKETIFERTAHERIRIELAEKYSKRWIAHRIKQSNSVFAENAFSESPVWLGFKSVAGITYNANMLKHVGLDLGILDDSKKSRSHSE